MDGRTRNRKRSSLPKKSVERAELSRGSEARLRATPALTLARPWKKTTGTESPHLDGSWFRLSRRYFSRRLRVCLLLIGRSDFQRSGVPSCPQQQVRLPFLTLDQKEASIPLQYPMDARQSNLPAKASDGVAPKMRSPPHLALPFAPSPIPLKIPL